MSREAGAVGQGGPHQFRLLRQRRFAPFFWTVFLGSVNDNLLKFAVTLLLTYQVVLPWMPPAVAGAVLGGVFILPSLLLSAVAGQWADRIDMARLIRMGKAWEVAMMALAAWAIWRRDAPAMLLCVLFSGVHVSVFATVKYAYLPLHLRDSELTGGNGVLEMGTFMAILLGTLAGGVLVGAEAAGGSQGWLPGLLIVLSVTGWLLSRRIPRTPPVSPGLVIDWNPVSQAWRILNRCRAQPELWLCLLGISWMWFFGAVYLSLMPVLTRSVMQAQESVAALLLVLTSLGIASGAVMCEAVLRARLAHGPQAALGLVPLGALGMALFGADLAWMLGGWPGQDGPALRMPAMAPPHGVMALLSQRANWRALLDLWLMAMSIGLFSVPLYARMQSLAEPAHRARVVSANNILNALFILGSAVLTWALGAGGYGVGQSFAVVAVLHAVVSCMTLWWQPSLGRAAVALLRRRRSLCH